MPVPTLYGFLTDDAFRRTARLDLTGASDQGYGALYGEPASYLVNRGTLGDTRSRRSMILESEAPKGQIALLFDQNRFDTAILSKMTDTECQRLFNIIERIYLQQEYSDGLIENQLTGNSSYQGYVAHSFTHSTNTGNAVVTNVSNVTKTVAFWDWYSFEFRSGEVDFTLQFWVSRAGFTRDYPFVTITRVIPPYSPEILISPSKLLEITSLTVLTGGSNFIFDQTNLEMVARNQNGVYTYNTKYVVTANQNIQLPFALAYCGPRAPSSLECREAIKDYLQEETGIGDDALIGLFPELFVNSRFYIVPLWDNYTQLTDREVYNSIQPLSVIVDRATKIFSSFEAEWRDKYLEILLNAQNKMWSICLPDTLNSDHFSILEQHPTYQDYSSQVPGWKYMTATTQEFAGKLNRCLAVLNGDSTSSEFISATDNNFSYLVFTAGESEYYVMEQASYLNYLENLA